jgi:hypothetical protein
VSICADEDRTGRSMTAGERESFARDFFATEYFREAKQLSYLMALILEDDMDKKLRAHSGRGPTGPDLLGFF